jgi:hypothetical protein
MTRTEFKHIANTEGFDEAISKLSEETNTILSEEYLIEYIKHLLDKVNYVLTAHVLNGIVNSEGESRWYNYDISCGILEKPVCINTVEEALTFDYFD